MYKIWYYMPLKLIALYLHWACILRRKHSFLPDKIEDINLVPVAISYEKLIDGNFCSEQMVRCI